MQQIRVILVPTDFSVHADRAVEQAVELSRRLSARLHLLHAYQVSMYIGVGEPVALPQEFFDQIRARAEERLQAVRDKVEKQGIKVDASLVHDIPASAVVEAARQLPADLIVMGTRGLTGVKHVLLGSVAERVVRLAPCPVMTVKAD